MPDKKKAPFVIRHHSMFVREPDVLHVWTIYDHPSDCPGNFVARRHDVRAGTSTPTMYAVASPSLESLRGLMQRLGLTCVMRDAADDPLIVESWI